MSFYLFRLETIRTTHRRGNIPDDDVISFSVVINQADRGHGAALFQAMTTNSVATTDDRKPDGALAYRAENRLNMSERWETGPFEIAPTDHVGVAYTGTNTSDYGLSGLGTQQQDELEIKILNVVFKKYVGFLLGYGVLDDIAGAFSQAFDRAFKDPVGGLIGYQQQGPCNGPVFAGQRQFRGSDLDHLALGPPAFTLYPGTAYPGTRFTETYTDAANHNTDICGHPAETDVTFAVFRVPFISVKTWARVRFPGAFLNLGLGKLVPPRPSLSVKSLLGVRP